MSKGGSRPPRKGNKNSRSIPYVTVALQLGKSLKTDPYQIWLISGGATLHGVYGDNIPGSAYFRKKRWNPYMNEDLKYALMSKMPSFNPSSDSDLSSDCEVQLGFWKRLYKTHSHEVMMTQDDYFTFGINKFNLLRAKVNSALYQNYCAAPIDTSERRKLDLPRFLSFFKGGEVGEELLEPTVHFCVNSSFKVAGKKAEVMKEVRFYFSYPDFKMITFPGGKPLNSNIDLDNIYV